MSVTLTKRFSVFKRDLFICQYCGRSPPTVVLECDHVIAVSDGGCDDIENLVTACFDCNRGKGKHALTEVPPLLVDAIALRKEKLEQVCAFNEFLMEERNSYTDAVVYLGIHWENKYRIEKDQYTFGDDRQPSIRQFLKHLPPAEILEAIDLAWSKFPASFAEKPRKDGQLRAKREHGAVWVYFCGVCWTKIKANRIPKFQKPSTETIEKESTHDLPSQA